MRVAIMPVTLVWLLGIFDAILSTRAWTPSSRVSRQNPQQRDLLNTPFPLKESTAISDNGRRVFLHQALVGGMAIGVGLPFVPNIVWAAEGSIENVPSIVPDSPSTNAQAGAAESSSASTLGDKVTMEELKQDEKDLVKELKADQVDQGVTEKEASQLLEQLEQQAKTESSSSSSSSSSSNTSESNKATKQQQMDEASASQKTQQLVEKLEQDEEKVQAETLELIDKVEKLQAEADALQTNILPESAKTAQKAIEDSKTETKEFIEALKERSEENQDLIEMLKARSQQYYNAKTGRYNSMSKQDFLQRKDDFLNRENAAVQLLQRYREEFQAEKEQLLPQKETDAALVELLKSRAKLTEEFVSTYNTFLQRLQQRLSEQ